ncbi:MAG: hypothetical protein IPP40_16595 [bacterium]|nr:hypothetical protein [bacterium]
MKFSPAGTLLWRRVYENSFDGSYTRKCLVDEQDAIYVLGMGPGPSNFATKVKKFTADGDSFGVTLIRRGLARRSISSLLPMAVFWLLGERFLAVSMALRRSAETEVPCGVCPVR